MSQRHCQAFQVCYSDFVSASIVKQCAAFHSSAVRVDFDSDKIFDTGVYCDAARYLRRPELPRKALSSRSSSYSAKLDTSNSLSFVSNLLSRSSVMIEGRDVEPFLGFCTASRSANVVNGRQSVWSSELYSISLASGTRMKHWMQVR